MKRSPRTAILLWITISCVLMLHLTAFDVLAAEDAGDWRTTFDLVMRWVNFLILAAVLVKFAKNPIREFLEGKKEDIAREIEKVEAEKERLLRQIEASQQQLEDSKARLPELKKNIIAQGEKIQQKIIQDAKLESEIMLQSARQKIESRFIEARQMLISELVDSAVALAMEKLPEKITESDNQKFLAAFLSRAASK